jgi:hypothetical protein
MILANSVNQLKLPSRGAARLKLGMRRKSYLQWLERADDADCLTLIWAVRALQSGKAHAARNYISFPKEAAMDDIVGDDAIYCGVRLVRKRYPLDIGALLPWWNKFGKPEDRPGN